MSLFSSTTSSTPLFGTSTSKPLFGGSPATTTAPKPGGLFGSTTPAATSSVPLFGTTTTAPATTSAGSLFGSTTATSAAPATGGLFGASTTSTTGGLLGATTSTTTSGGLFGAKPATTTTSTLGGGLFGATPAATTTSLLGSATTTTAPSLGLGGVQQDKNLANASGSATNSLTGGDKDGAREAELQAANFMREMLPLIEEKLKKNRDLIEEVENMSVDSLPIDDMIDKTRGWISEVRRNVRNATEASKNVALLTSHDKALLDTAKRVQEQAATANQSVHANSIKKHLMERTNVYDLEMHALQNRVTELTKRFEKLLNGEPSLTMEELDGYFRRCDATAASAQHSIQEVGREIEELKNQLIEQGYTHLRRSYQPYPQNASIPSRMEGAEFFPSQSSLAVIGSSLRAPAAAPAVGGLGLGTGTSLFGSNTGGSSLFGSTTAAKPTFTGGSLFGNLSSTTSTTPATTTSTSLFGAKPSTTFASTVSNNSSGLLFSSKK